MLCNALEISKMLLKSWKDRINCKNIKTYYTIRSKCREITSTFVLAKNKQWNSISSTLSKEIEKSKETMKIK